jgi:hypothetical protein
VKQFKKLILILSALLVVAFSFSFTRPSDVNNSYRSNAIEFHLTAISADDVDDDFGDPGFEKIFLEFNYCNDYNATERRSQPFDSHHTSIPFYLQIRNLRI